MFHEVKKCRCCGSDQLCSYLDLGNQPLANSYHNGLELDRFPLKVMLCENCFHSQLSIVIDPKIMYSKYLYVSSTTETFRKHCDELADDVIKRIYFGINNKLRVCDIAMNDGLLLECFQRRGCHVLGVEPATNLVAIAKQKEINVINDFWHKDIKLPDKCDIITATNVFAHVDDIHGFLLGCLNNLNEDGTVLIEFPYCKNLINQVEFDTIYHEHLSYFLVNSFKQIVERSGMYIFDVMQTKIHGGSIRFFLKKNKDDKDHNLKVYDLINSEQISGLFNKKNYIKFSKKVKRNKKNFTKMIRRLKKKYKVVGYGASAKSTVMLNYFNVKLDYIIDNNPLKVDLLTPGKNVKIVALDHLKNDKSKKIAIVILAWNFYEEIKKRIRSARGKGDIAIMYVPKVFKEKI